MDLIRLAFFIGTLVFLALYDIKKGIIPNAVIYPAMALTLLVSLLSPAASAPASLLAGASGAMLLMVAGLIQHKMGMGDVKLAFLIGLMTGLPDGIVALFGGIFLGGVAAILLLLLRIKGRKDEMPYAPFLSAGAILVLLGGPYIMNLIMRLF